MVGGRVGRALGRALVRYDFERALALGDEDGRVGIVVDALPDRTSFVLFGILLRERRPRRDLGRADDEVAHSTPSDVSSRTFVAAEAARLKAGRRTAETYGQAGSGGILMRYSQALAQTAVCAAVFRDGLSSYRRPCLLDRTMRVALRPLRREGARYGL